MKIAINAWSIPPDVSFHDMFSQVCAAGFDGIELNLDTEDRSAHSLTMTTSSTLLDEINSISQACHLPVCSISTSLYGSAQLGSPLTDIRRRGQAVLRRQLELARALSADTILVVPGGISETVDRATAYELALNTLAELRGEIVSSGVAVGLENVWNSFFLSPTDLIQFIDQLDCPAIGAYFDVGNVAVFSYPENWIDMLAHRIRKIHVKDFRRTSSWYRGHFANLYEGSIDWSRVISALRSAGYDDWLTAELPSMPQNPQYLYRITADAMRCMVGQQTLS